MTEITTEPELNVPLFRKVMEHVTAHPEELDLDVWIAHRTCGTRGCIAGWTVLLSGYEPHFGPYDSVHTGYLTTGERVKAVAQRELGLTDSQASDLFFATADIDAVWDLIEEYSHGAITRPPA